MILDGQGDCHYSIEGTMLENSTDGLTLLDAAHTVVVAGVEHHQPVLAPWAPFADELPRHVAVELRPAPVTIGYDAGRPGVEVLLDGWRIGELAPTPAERYLPHVHDLLALGARPAAVGLVGHGPQGELEVELRLPDVTDEATTAMHVVHPDITFAPVPRPRDPRIPYLIGGGVLALLLVVGVTVGAGNRSDETTWTRPAAAPTTARTSPAPIPTVAATETGIIEEIADDVVAEVVQTRPRVVVPTTPPPPPPPAPVVVVPTTTVAPTPTTEETIALLPPKTITATNTTTTTTQSPAPCIPTEQASCPR
ncbi:hypothetical protein [Pseudonocardia broussonetiae]|uniref:Uncharacterized protein n=1 Tax=Pseudonocardia broussonetiae TaxID=2736640 RepID=A0A6M6JF91_9PSEU|nr:hypothetical protein [Pseudonocardia broussonetiae]QJY45029.1 hypothetical protein HOP40_03625 [Pseudonocardia broussonetiae]